FNRDNVTLVDVGSNAIEKVTPRDVQLTSGRKIDLDTLVCATDYDGLTGALFEANKEVVGGQTLADAGNVGEGTEQGISTHGYPNMYFVAGPGSPSVLSNVVVSIEQHVEWISEHIEWLRKNNLKRSEVTEEAQDQWTQHVYET